MTASDFAAATAQSGQLLYIGYDFGGTAFGSGGEATGLFEASLAFANHRWKG